MRVAARRKAIQAAARRIDEAAEQAAKIRKARVWKFDSTAELRAMRDGYRAGRERRR
jgi:hypothetical protein